MLEADVAALRRRVEHLESRRRQPDALADGRLLSELARIFGQGVFSAIDVQAAATQDADLGAAVHGLTTRQIGALLRRHTADGPYRVHRVGRDSCGVLWALYVDPSTYTPLR